MNWHKLNGKLYNQFFPYHSHYIEILSMRSHKFGWGVGDLKSIFWGESGVKVKKNRRQRGGRTKFRGKSSVPCLSK